MADRGGAPIDDVWEHGVNMHPGFQCKCCKSTKRGGGATRFKQHLAGRGGNVISCSCVPPNVRDYYRRQLDRTADKKERVRESLRLEEVAREGNVVHDVDDDDDDDDELQAALRASREEAEYARHARARGGQYEHGGGSSQAQGGGVFGMLKRSMSSKGKQTVQSRIDTGP